MKKWHRLALPVIRTKEWEETIFDFLDGWGRIQFVAGAGPVDHLWDVAGALTIPGAERYDRPEVRRLVGLCSLLQRHSHGKSFFLGCRTVARLAGVHYTTAWRWLRLLELTGVLERTSTRHAGDEKSQRVPLRPGTGEQSMSMQTDQTEQPLRMPFGMYRGQLLSEVDTGYLLWLHGLRTVKSRLRREVVAELDRRDVPESDRPTPGG